MPVLRVRLTTVAEPTALGFPNASCAVDLIDRLTRLTHHAEIILIEGESYRKREAELAQKKRRAAP